MHIFDNFPSSKNQIDWFSMIKNENGVNTSFKYVAIEERSSIVNLLVKTYK